MPPYSAIIFIKDLLSWGFRFIFKVMDENGEGLMTERDIFNVLKQVRPGDSNDELEMMSADIMEEGIARY